MDKHFIATSDRETYKKLKQLGYQEINYDGKRWFFLNDFNKTVFEDEGMKDVHQTDILHF